MLTLLGPKYTSEHLIRALRFHPLLSRVFTHTYRTSLPLFSLQSHNERFRPRTPPLCPCLIPEAQRARLPLSPFFVLSHFIPMPHSSRVRIFIFSLPPFPPPHLGRQRPTGTYLVSVFIPTACLWPTGKLQSVICLQVDRNLPFSSSLSSALTSKLVTTLCLNLRRVGSLGSECVCLFAEVVLLD